MSEQEVGGIVLLCLYGLMLIGAIRVFGIRPVLAILVEIIFLGVTVAIRSLAVITGRRY